MALANASGGPNASAEEAVGGGGEKAEEVEQIENEEDRETMGDGT